MPVKYLSLAIRDKYKYKDTSKEKEGKEEHLYSSVVHQGTHKALRHGSQFYLQTTPCLPFLREHSPDGTTTTTEAANIQLQLTTHLATPKG